MPLALFPRSSRKTQYAGKCRIPPRQTYQRALDGADIIFDSQTYLAGLKTTISGLGLTETHDA